MLQDETLCADRFIGMLTPCSRPPHLHGTFADHAHIHPRAGRIRVPDAVDSELASAASCALRSVIAAFNRLGALDYRDTVLIQGAGPLGLFATAVASMHAPRRLIVIGAPDARLELAREFGADATISIEAYPDPAERTAIVIWRRRRRSSSRAASAEDIAGFVLGGVLPEPPPYESVRCQFRISDGAKPGANISRPRMSPRARARRTAA
jgi:hypothetical protein